MINSDTFLSSATSFVMKTNPHTPDKLQQSPNVVEFFPICQNEWPSSPIVISWLVYTENTRDSVELIKEKQQKLITHMRTQLFIYIT